MRTLLEQLSFSLLVLSPLIALVVILELSIGCKGTKTAFRFLKSRMKGVEK